MIITIELSEAEAKALSFIANDPQEWAENFVRHRAQKAIDLIFQQEVLRMLDDPNTTKIPADKEEVVLSADLTRPEKAPAPPAVGDEIDAFDI